MMRRWVKPGLPGEKLEFRTEGVIAWFNPETKTWRDLEECDPPKGISGWTEVPT